MTLLFPRLAAASLALFCGVASADVSPRPTVLELFTSQGCSSCPPAEAYLHTLSGRSDVIALAFHVDYWDSLGWRDRFALPQSVDRQNVYAQRLHRRSVYTPQLVIDGQSDHVGSDQQGIEKQLQEKHTGVPVVLAVRGGMVQIVLSAAPEAAQSDLVLVAYLRRAESKIGRGENSGRTLEEFNIVRSVRTLASWKGEAKTLEISTASLPADATDVAVLVQRAGQGAIIGAAASPLARQAP